MQFNVTFSVQEPNDHAIIRTSRKEKFEVLIESTNETQCTRFLRRVRFWPHLAFDYCTTSRRVVEVQGTFSLTRNYQTFESVGKWYKMFLKSILKILNLLKFLITNHIRFQIFREQNSTWEMLKVEHTGVPRKVILFSVKSLKSRQLFKQYFMIFLRVERR